jgi:hypothetical protein
LIESHDHPGRQNLDAMTAVSAESVLRLPVRVRGIQLGRSIDLVLDRACRRVLGFEILCGDEERRFLPLSVATVGRDDVQVGSPLVLLDGGELRFYTRGGCTFRALRGTDVVRRGVAAGRLRDFAFEHDGTISSVSIETAIGTERLAYDAQVELAAPRPRLGAAS